MITLLVFLVIIMFYFKEKLYGVNLKFDYDQLFEYLNNTESLLEKY